MCFRCCTVVIFHFQDECVCAFNFYSVKYVTCICKKGLKWNFEQVSQVKMSSCWLSNLHTNNLPIVALSFSKSYLILNSWLNASSRISAGIWFACVRIPTCLDRGWTGFKTLSKQSVICRDSYSDWLHKTSWYFCMKSIQIFTPYWNLSSERRKDLPRFQLNCLNYLFSFPEERSCK